VHLPLADHLLLADHGNIVLGLAGDNASIATNAGVQVDTHRPGGGSFGLPTIQVRLRLVGGERPRGLAILGKCCVPDIFSRLVEDQIMVVCGGQIYVAGYFLQRRRTSAASERIKIEAAASCDGPGMPLAETKKRRDAIRRLAG